MKTEANGGNVPTVVQEQVDRIIKSICQLPYRSIAISNIKSAQVSLFIRCGSK